MKVLFNFIISKTEFDSKVREILQRSDYVQLANNIKDWVENLKERIIRWIMDLLDNTFENMPSSKGISENLSIIFIIAGILIITGIVVFIAVRMGKVFERNSRVKEILGESIGEGVTTASLRRKASEYADAADFRMAVRYEYIALLLLLHEKNLIYLEDTKTNEEIIKSLLESKFSMLDVLQNMAVMFNASWYGHKAFLNAAYEDWSGKLKLVWEKVSADEKE